ncbi:dispanin subfamily A member 2b-like [Pimephales promelas]|nr:dispanin subfamily A member 2b-like [Pimephales promelas]
MAQASSPLYCQGNNPGNHHAVHPDSVQIQLHPQFPNHPNEPVVVVQPPVYRANAPLADPVPDYMCYSRFTMLCCCICLGACALGYSRATRKANIAGQRAEAASNSTTALVLNHLSVLVGLICITLYLLDTFYFEEKRLPF